jgi:hypothetical protein
MTTHNIYDLTVTHTHPQNPDCVMKTKHTKLNVEDAILICESYQDRFVKAKISFHKSTFSPELKVVNLFGKEI